MMTTFPFVFIVQLHPMVYIFFLMNLPLFNYNLYTTANV